jgi:hypothetical protein
MNSTHTSILKYRFSFYVRCRLVPLYRVLCVTSILFTVNPALADPLSAINTLRTEGCAGTAPAGTQVVPSAPLDNVARELSVTRQLSEAIERTGYPAGNSVAVYVRGRIERSRHLPPR